jgi:diguanylate cyclase (GGDEF)-like protein
MQHPDRLRFEQSNAEILLWQTRYRLALVALVAGLGCVLRQLGVLPESPVVAVTIGASRAQALLGILAALYVAFVLVLHRRLSSSRRAGVGATTAVMLADLLVLFGCVFLITSPGEYERALILALFSLQLTQVYFGRTPALLALAAIATAYIVIVNVAIEAGAPLRWGEELFTLGLFILGSFMLVMALSGLHGRLATLVHIFERAEEGDFTDAYDESADHRPDAITLVGRAYNRMRTQLSSFVLTDPLSGCMNRRGFEQQLARELARAARAETHIALLALDVDHFKEINDTFGHIAGDEVIQEIGQLLRETARTADVVARVGGDEFIVLAPATNPEGTQQLASRIVDAFRRRDFRSVGRTPITISVGAVSEPVPNDAIAEELRARADEALYTAKRAGRDRVVIWTRGMTNAADAPVTSERGS